MIAFLDGDHPIEEVAQRYYDKPFFLYLGRHIGLPVCLEGALKLKEIAYVPTEAYSAGEMKHGPIALLDQDTPVVCIATNSHVYDKVVSNIQETRARGAHVIAIATDGNEDIQHHADDVIYVPKTPAFLQAVLAVLPLQQALVLRGPSSTSPLLGFRYGPRQTWLVRLDPKTLRARRGRRLALDSYSASWSYSPDRQLLALGNQTSAPITAVPARIWLVDVHTLHTLRVVPLGIDADVAYAHWVAPDRLIALVRSRDDEVARDQVVVVDPQTGAVEARQALDGHAICAARADHALVLVLEGAAYGPVRVVVAYDDGRLASVTLDQVQAGTRRTPDGVPRVDGAALAVDRQGGRAFVVAAGDPVAEVALDSLAVQYHTLAQPVSLLGRLHDWLEPPAQAKGPFEGSWRSAVWLGDGP